MGDEQCGDSFRWPAVRLSHTYSVYPFSNPQDAPPIWAATQPWAGLPALYSRAVFHLHVSISDPLITMDLGSQMEHSLGQFTLRSS